MATDLPDASTATQEPTVPPASESRKFPQIPWWLLAMLLMVLLGGLGCYLAVKHDLTVLGTGLGVLGVAMTFGAWLHDFLKKKKAEKESVLRDEKAEDRYTEELEWRKQQDEQLKKIADELPRLVASIQSKEGPKRSIQEIQAEIFANWEKEHGWTEGTAAKELLVLARKTKADPMASLSDKANAEYLEKNFDKARTLFLERAEENGREQIENFEKANWSAQAAQRIVGTKGELPVNFLQGKIFESLLMTLHRLNSDETDWGGTKGLACLTKMSPYLKRILEDYRQLIERWLYHSDSDERKYARLLDKQLLDTVGAALGETFRDERNAQGAFLVRLKELLLEHEGKYALLAPDEQGGYDVREIAHDPVEFEQPEVRNRWKSGRCFVRRIVNGAEKIPELMLPMSE